MAGSGARMAKGGALGEGRWRRRWRDYQGAGRQEGGQRGQARHPGRGRGEAMDALIRSL
jgi:hypothetical protein